MWHYRSGNPDFRAETIVSGAETPCFRMVSGAETHVSGAE